MAGRRALEGARSSRSDWEGRSGMPRNTRTTPNRKDTESRNRSHPNEGTRMHGSRSNEADRELRLGKNKDGDTDFRRSTSRTRPTSRGH